MGLREDEEELAAALEAAVARKRARDASPPQLPAPPSVEPKVHLKLVR